MVKRESDLDGGASCRSLGSRSKLDYEIPAMSDDAASQTLNSRRVLRSRYQAVKTMINDERDEIARPDSDKFDLIFSEMESLHQLVTKPREQVADAKALLDIINNLVMSVKAHADGGLTPSDFVSYILKEFGGQGRPSSSTDDCVRNSIAWKDLGLAVSHVFQVVPRCCTMIGPIDAKTKQRKAVNGRKHVKPTELTRPEEELLCTNGGEFICSIISSQRWTG